MKTLQEYNVIGLMSGTSLDGVDLAFCKFKFENGKWNFEILKAKTFDYSDEWKNRLKNLHLTDALSFVKANADLGKLFGELVRDFIAEHDLKPGLISSHGHTVFHQPENGFTSQIGDGAQIAAITGIETVCDFRTIDVALGGQGAPLVPIGDKFLFHEYDFCLNLGGIANISFKKNNERFAFDICPVNMALNFLASESGLNYDNNGELAATGKINASLLEKLNMIDYYKSSPPKSIGKEWFIKNFEPVISAKSISLNDRLRTVCEHIAAQVANASGFQKFENSVRTHLKMLITGGGTHNAFLIHCINEKLNKSERGINLKTVIPSKEIIDFKEALVFAFLGVLRIRKEVNVLRSVTGASNDNTGGAIYSAH